jgi:hypothetical protein
MHSFLSMYEGLFLRGTMRRAPRKFWSLSHEGAVFVAPIDDDFVFGHSTSASLYFKISARLLDLVRLSLAAFSLQVDFLLYPSPAKEMVAAYDPLLEVQALQQ